MSNIIETDQLRVFPSAAEPDISTVEAVRGNEGICRFAGGRNLLGFWGSQNGAANHRPCVSSPRPAHQAGRPASVATMSLLGESGKFAVKSAMSVSAAQMQLPPDAKPDACVFSFTG